MDPLEAEAGQVIKDCNQDGRKGNYERMPGSDLTTA